MPSKSLQNCLQTFTGHTRRVLSANFSPDGKQIVSASGDGSLKLWDLAKSQSLRLLSIEAETICLPSGLKFALQTQSVCPAKVCRQLPVTGHTHRVLSANFSPDGKQIVSASGDGSLKLWDLAGKSVCHAVSVAWIAVKALSVKLKR
jgi:WD40 repeat protein